MRRAVALDPLNPHTHFSLDQALMRPGGYSEWGDTDRALDWLETGVRNHDPYLVLVKTGFAPLRNEPRFQAIERVLKFPQ